MPDRIKILWREEDKNKKDLADDLWVKEVQGMLPKGSRIIQVNAGVDEDTGRRFVQYYYTDKDGKNVLELKL